MLVSIVIPTHNRAELLLELLSSIRDQSHRPVEVVVVDDASTDHTDQVIECFAKEICSDTGIVVTGSIMRKSGAQAARNEGIRLARGEALMFVDSDDIFAPQGLADLVCVLEQQPALAYAFGKVAITGATIDLDPTAWRGVVGERFDGTSAGLAGYHWHTMGALYRREWFLKAFDHTAILSAPGNSNFEMNAVTICDFCKRHGCGSGPDNKSATAVAQLSPGLFVHKELDGFR